MIQNTIPKALSTFLTHQIKALLIGGQACIFYGAAEFSRDVDFSVLVTPENLQSLKAALEELEAERIFWPDLSEEVLLKGHACHFRFPKKDPRGLRIDILGKMRGLDPFPLLWDRRTEINIPNIGMIALLGLGDIIKSKKTQRDKDWPMIRRLVEEDIIKAADDPAVDQIEFWLSECRTRELIIELAEKYSEVAKTLLSRRPLLGVAFPGQEIEIQRLLREEEEIERNLDREYWAPLKKELEAWRRSK